MIMSCLLIGREFVFPGNNKPKSLGIKSQRIKQKNIPTTPIYMRNSQKSTDLNFIDLVC